MGKRKTDKITMEHHNTYTKIKEDSYQNDINGTTGNNNGSINNQLDQTLSPTQALCLMTTVPQNIASRSLGDKHTPTRNSLRHSRMIVMNKNGKVPKKFLPFIIRHYTLVKTMKVLTIAIGSILCVLSIWTVLWTPTLSIQDYPYWSAGPVLISGVVGCFFLGFCPRPYPGRSLGWHYHLTKFTSILTTAVSILSALVVTCLGLVHMIYLHMASCSPHDQLNSTCVCSTTDSPTIFFGDSYHYQDLTCDEVQHYLNALVVAVSFLNVLAAVLDVMYLCVHWTSNRKYVYAKVPVSDVSIVSNEFENNES